MLILVTGSEGFIGTAIVSALRSNKHQVIGVDIKSDTPIDIRDIDQLETVFSANNFDAVIHLGALKDVMESMVEKLNYYTTNIDGTLNVVSLCDKYCVPTLLFASSDSVTFNTSPYSKSKLIGESLVETRRYGRGFSIRLASVLRSVGDTYQVNHTSLLDNLLRVYTGDKEYIEIFSQALRRFCTLDTAVSAILKALDADLRRGTFSMNSSAISVTPLTMLRIFSEVFGINIPYEMKLCDWEREDTSTLQVQQHEDILRTELTTISNMKHILQGEKLW